MERGRIIMNNTDYTGSFVTPNPSEPPTKDLNTLEIEGEVYNIQGNGDGGTSIILNGQIYSTEEKVVGVWKNNKPLYQKTCVFGSVSGQTANLSLGITNIEEVFLCADASYVNNGTCPLPYVTGTAYANNIGGFFDIGVNDTSFAIRIGQSMSGYVNSVVLTVRYTKTTDTAGSGGFQAYGFTPVIYSTEEREVGVWTDNKPLYQKTVYFNGTIARNNFATIDSSLKKDDVGVFLVVDAEFRSNEGLSIYGNYSIGGSNADIGIHPSSGVYIENYTVFPINEARVTYRYTKTTDVAGSGEYNTLGVPNIHYDGNEKVIGTWFGKTLYQKTLVIHNESTVSSNTTITTIDSTFRVKNWKAFAIENGVNYKVPYVAGNGNASFYFRENGNVDFTIKDTSFAAGSDFYITIEYTKTTD